MVALIQRLSFFCMKTFRNAPRGTEMIDCDCGRRVCSGRVTQITYAMTAAVLAYAVRRCLQTFIPLCACRLGFQMCCRGWYHDDYRNHGQDMVPVLVQGSEPGADLSHANSSKPKLCRKGSGRCGTNPTGNRVSSRTRLIVVGTSRRYSTLSRGF